MSSETDKVSPPPAPVTPVVTDSVTDEIQPADDSISNGSSTLMPGSVNNPKDPVLTGVAAANEQLTESSSNNAGASTSDRDDAITNECKALRNLIRADLVLIENVKTRVSNYSEQITKERECFQNLPNDQAGAVESFREMKKRVKILKQLVTSKHKEEEEDSNKLKSLQTNDSADGIRNLDPKVLMKMPSLYASKTSFMQTRSFQDFQTRYNSLDDVLKLCLLSFSVFPENEIIKKRIMINWWIGEGFAPPVNIQQQQENVATPNGDIPLQNATQIAEQNVNLSENTPNETPNGDIPPQNTTQIAEQNVNLNENTQNETPNGDTPMQNATQIAEQNDNLSENIQNETPNGDIPPQNATEIADQNDNLSENIQSETPNGDIPRQNATQIAEQNDNLSENIPNETPNGDIRQQNATEIADQNDNLSENIQSETPNGDIPRQNATQIAEQNDNLSENTLNETPNEDIPQPNATQIADQNENLSESIQNETPNGDIPQQNATQIAEQNDNLSENTHHETPNGDLPQHNATQITDQNDNLSVYHSTRTTNQETTTEEDPNKITKTAEDYANEFFKELIKKGFIEPVYEKHPFIQDKTAGSCKLHPFTRSMVIMLAEKANFFDFDKEAGSPINDSSHSLRACITKGNMVTQNNKLEMLHTLFNVNEDTLEIKRELLGRMENLNVLYLGRWQSSAKHHIEVEDVKNLKNETVGVLDGLENLNHLKFFSIQGISRITELPRSLCKLSNLIILDIRACHNLELLPKEIGMLKNLTHLDMSECYLLDQMPKGLSSLSKLQVLKGFVVTEDSDEKKSCKLMDLGKLPLRKLSIYTGLMDFPKETHLRSLNKFKGLVMLTIAWGRGSLQDKTTSQTSLPEESSSGNLTTSNKSELTQDGVKKKKPPNSYSMKGLRTKSKTLLTLSSSRKVDLSIAELPPNLMKLNLVCFPMTKTPDWMKPSSLENLKRLYIRGGKFSDLGQIQDVDDQKAEWKVEVLRLKYLDELEMEWGEFLELFPQVSYLEKVRCPRLTFFPCNQSGVWVRKPKKK